MKCAIYARVSTAKFLCPSCKHTWKAIEADSCPKCSFAISNNDSKQNLELQLQDLRIYAQSKGWTICKEYKDKISGSKNSRPALDELMQAAFRKQFDIILVWRLDRLGRSFKHLIFTLEEFKTLGIAFVSYKDAIDMTTPAGRLMAHVLGSVAEFIRELIRENILAGLTYVEPDGTIKKGLSRKGKRLGAITKPLDLDKVRELKAQGLSLRAIAREVGVSTETVRRRS